MVVEEVIELIIDKWWYLIPVAIGFLFRINLENKDFFEFGMRAKVIFVNILILALFTASWNNLYKNFLDDNSVYALLGGTFIYIFYKLAKRCEPMGGTTESFLLIINSVMLIMLSFQPLKGTIFWAIIIVVISYMVYNFFEEKLSDLIEILIICFESIIISVIMTKKEVDGFVCIFTYVFFIETAIFMLNYIVKDLVASHCD